MAAYEEKTGGQVLAIAHNGNLSQRPHVPDDRVVHRQSRSTASTPRRAPSGSGSTRRRRSRATARRIRSSRPTTNSPNFERWDKGNLDLTRAEEAGDAGVRVRALGAEERPRSSKQELGVNPYKFGMIGSHRRAHRPRGGRGGQLLRQDLQLRAERRRVRRIRSSTNPTTGDRHHGLGADGVRLRRRVGARRTRASRSSTRWSARRPMPPPARAWSCASSAAGISRPADADNRMPAKIGYAKGVPMGGDLRDAPQGQGADLPGRRAEGSDRREPRPLSRSSRAGSMRRARCTSRSTTWRGAATASPAPTASSRRSATPWTWRTRPGPTPSAHRN